MLLFLLALSPARACVRVIALRLTSEQRFEATQTRPLSNLSLSSPRPPLLPPLPPPSLPPSPLLFLPDSDPLRRYAYDRVSLCKASATGETRTPPPPLLLLTAGRPRAPNAGWRATQAGQQERETPPLINVHRKRRRETLTGKCIYIYIFLSTHENTERVYLCRGGGRAVTVAVQVADLCVRVYDSWADWARLTNMQELNWKLMFILPPRAPRATNQRYGRNEWWSWLERSTACCASAFVYYSFLLEPKATHTNPPPKKT